MERIKIWTRKVHNGYCSHYLRDKDMMEDLGIDEDNYHDPEFDNYHFSLLIDHLGRLEDLFKTYKISNWEQLEKILAKDKFARDQRKIVGSKKKRSPKYREEKYVR